MLSDNNLTTIERSSEIKQIIEDRLAKNEKLGFLHNNLFYINVFETEDPLNQTFFTFGLLSFLFYLALKENEINGSLFIIIAICLFIIGAILKIILKYYLIYDIDREVFYNITKINNLTISKSGEISINDFIELGVNQTFKDDAGHKPKSSAMFFKGDINDNPGIRTSFVALNNDGKIINLSYPVGTKEAEANAVAACELFSECFGLNSVICDKKEYLIVSKDEKQNYIFNKSSLIKDLEYCKEFNIKFLKLFLIGFLIFAIFMFLLFIIMFIMLVCLHLK